MSEVANVCAHSATVILLFCYNVRFVFGPVSGVFFVLFFKCFYCFLVLFSFAIISLRKR